jgi:hypothetical protein
MRVRTAAPMAVLTAVLLCSVAVSPQQSTQPVTEAQLAELWQDPVDLLRRDLRAGPGGVALAPKPESIYDFVAHKTSGVNPGYDVRDAAGRLWSVKLGEEAQSEVTASRILWAMGFHQPATYYVASWTLAGEDAGVKTNARFRADGDRDTATGEWSWYENPFVGTQAFRGLIVAQMILSSWDLKTSNNRVYDAIDPAETPRRRYIVRDLGSSLGSARQHPFFAFLGTRGRQGTKNDLDGFERQGFIEKVEGTRVHFDYRGLNEALVSIVTPRDVVWACELLARLPQGHWDAAFAAGGFSEAETSRYVAKIKAKIEQGLALRASPTTARRLDHR